MIRRWVALSVLFALPSVGAWAQGLNVPAGVTKDDWEEINFEYNSAVLVDGFPSLLRLAELLQKNSGYKVRVEGHTDVIGSNRANERLGLARANAVRDFLVKYGAQGSQITTASDGKQNPKYPGQKPNYSRTDEARYMNRRVSLTVTDAQGRQVSAGGAGEAIRAIEAPAQAAAPPANPECCNEVLKRLDKLDEIAKMLKDLADANADLRKQIADLRGAQESLQKGQATLESKVNEVPKPPTTSEIATEVEKTIEANKLPRFQLLGLNVGADDSRHTTFTGKGRYFAPFHERFAFEAQAEYLYFHNQREGQFDLGLVDRMGPVQAGLFASFKHVDMVGNQSGGTLGQGAFTLDYIFKDGKVGFFGTKGFMGDALINTTNAADPITGALLNSIQLRSYLEVVDQAGASTTLGLFGNNYLEGNAGWLHSRANGDHFGGTARFIFPLNSKIAFTIEGGMNETLVGNGNNGRAVVGVQFGNMLRPKEFQAARHPVPIDVPRVRYEVLTRRVRVGNTPPVADAGPPQNVPPGTVTLDGSSSYDPDGDPITFQWIQEAGPVATLSSPNSAKTTFTAISGAFYSFRLVVKDNYGGQGVARTTVTVSSAQPAQIIFFTANPGSIQTGQSSTLSWKVINADTITISGIGNVQATGTAPVSPMTTTTYTLTATNSTSQDTATAVVVVNPIATKLLYCYATPTSIKSGQSATLNWSATNANSVTIQPGVGSVALSGNVSVAPTQTTNYTITATGSDSSSTDSCSVSVTVAQGGGGTVAAPTIIRFLASPPTINSGQSSNLMWEVQNADTVNITTLGSVALNGNQSVSPAGTTTYTLTATNKAGTATATTTVTVNVIAPPKITSFTATPSSSPAPGTSITLACTATGATSLTVNNVVFNGSNASTQVAPTTTTTYTCIATGQNGQTDTATLVVPVTTSGGGGGAGGTPPTVVVAGGLSQTTIYRVITLDASASTGANPPLTFLWLQASGTPIAISRGNTATPTIELGNQGGEYDLNLTVTDSKGASTTVTVRIYLLATHVQ